MTSKVQYPSICPQCTAPMRLDALNLSEYLLMCSRCLFPFDAADIDEYIIPASSVASFTVAQLVQSGTPVSYAPSPSPAPISSPTPEPMSTEPSPPTPYSSPSSPLSPAPPSPSPMGTVQSDNGVNMADANWVTDLSNAHLVREKVRRFSDSHNFHINLQSKSGKKTLTLTGKSAKSLLQFGWFDDVIVNTYFELLSNRHPKTSYLNTYFAEMTDRATSRSGGWTEVKQIELMMKKGELEVVFVPVNTDAHWLLVVVLPPHRTAVVIDSLAENELFAKSNQMMALHRWLERVSPSTSPAQRWKWVFALDKPHQDLSHDVWNCGPYICYYAEMICIHKKINTELLMARNISQYRDVMMMRIFNMMVPQPTTTKPSAVPISPLQKQTHQQTLSTPSPKQTMAVATMMKTSPPSSPMTTSPSPSPPIVVAKAAVPKNGPMARTPAAALKSKLTALQQQPTPSTTPPSTPPAPTTSVAPTVTTTKVEPTIHTTTAESELLKEVFGNFDSSFLPINSTNHFGQNFGNSNGDSLDIYMNTFDDANLGFLNHYDPMLSA